MLLLGGCGTQAEKTVSASVVEAMSAPAGDNFARATEPRAFHFPQDHGPHPEYRTEWWYYTGNLTDTEGVEYGYQLTFFRTALTPDMRPRSSDLASNQVYMAHFALTDGGRQEHESFERFSRGAAGLAGAQGEPLFAAWLENWSAKEIEPGVVRLQAAEDGQQGQVAIDLTLRETRPPCCKESAACTRKGLSPATPAITTAWPGWRAAV